MRSNAMLKIIRTIIQSQFTTIFIFIIFILALFIYFLFDIPVLVSGKSVENNQIPNQPYRVPGTLMIIKDQQSPHVLRNANINIPGIMPAMETKNTTSIQSVRVMTETFEGTWPGTSWTVLDYSYLCPDCYVWGKRNCHPYQGTYAAWVTGDGIYGSAKSCSSNYAGDMSTVLRYGPLDWSDVISATITFYLWGESHLGDLEDPYDDDALFVGSALTCDEMWCLSAGEYYSGNYRNGIETNGYSRIEQKLIKGFGRAEVYITFSFSSDHFYHNTGFIIDNINLDVENGEWRYLPVILR